MIVLTTIKYKRVAVHKEDVVELLESSGTIAGNYNKPYTVVTLKRGEGYNVLESLDVILELLKGE